MSTIALTVRGRIVYISSIYLDILLPAKKPLFIELVRRCQEDNIPLLTGIDCNAHSQMWGCHEQNRRGKELEEMIQEEQLTVMNTGNEWTFNVGGRRSIIDITVLNDRAVLDLEMEKWRVDHTHNFSDHNYIKYTFGQYVPGTKWTRNLRRGRWLEFEAMVEEDIDPSWEEDLEMEDALERLYASMTKALDSACLLRKAPRHKPHRWWNEQLQQLKVKLAKLGDKHRYSTQRMSAYRELRAEFVKARKLARRTSWRDFAGTADNTWDVNQKVKALEGSHNKSIGLLRNSEGYTRSPQESLQVLLDAHFPNNRPVSDDSEGQTISSFEFTNSPLVSYITEERVKAALHSFGPYKSAGPDGFPPVALQALGMKARHLLTKIYQYSMGSGWVPNRWKSMRVVFIPKVGKDDYSIAKSYRPITLSNFLLKGLERLAYWYTQDGVVQRPLVSQHAYTRSVSTESALSEAVDIIESAYYQGGFALAVSLDCTGAFSEVRYESAVAAMKNFNIPEGLVVWYETLLRQRMVEANLQGVRARISPSMGSPQGGVLSPLVWNLVMDSLLRQFYYSNDGTRRTNVPVEAIGYADDVLLL
ncbi:Hypothetical predicted protein, partial [Paramuricea clavata]